MYLSIIGVYSFILILSVSCSSYFVAYNLFDEACQATLSPDFSNGTVQHLLRGKLLSEVEAPFSMLKFIERWASN